MDREFDKKEKKEIRDTLDVILTDIRALYDESGSDELKATFSHPDSYHHQYNLCVKKNMICFCCQEDNGHFVLEKRNALVKRSKITDYNEIYILLDQYEKVRQLLEEQALESSLEKENMSKKLQALRDKYSHETIVEIDVAETNNQRTIDIKEEDGLSIGEIRFGRDTIRLITKGSIVVSRDEKPKVKRK